MLFELKKLAFVFYDAAKTANSIFIQANSAFEIKQFYKHGH